MASDRPSWFRLNPGSPLANGLAFAGLGQLPGLLSYQDASPRHANGTLVNYTGTGNLPTDRWKWDGTLRRPALVGAGSDLNVTTGDHVAVTLPPLGTANSFAIWLKLNTNWTTIDTDGVIVFGGASSHWAIYIINDYRIGYNAAGAETMNTAPADTSIYVGKWVHLALVRKGTAVQTYANGKLAQTDAPLGSNTAGPVITSIGSYGDGSYGVPGSWADPMIWTRDLSAAEVAALADPSNVDLRFGGVPLIRPVRRLWPVVAAGLPPSTTALFRRFHSLRTGSRGVI